MSASAIDSKTLTKLPLFSALSEAQLAWLMPTVRQRTYPARACMLRAGDAPDGLYFILSGSARIAHEDGHGRELVTNVLGCSDFFGEMGLLDGGPSPASVHAAEGCEILHVPRRVVLECMEDNAPLSLSILRTAIERLCSAHEKMATLALVNVYGRVAQVLLENARQVDGEWRVDVRAEEIAALVGASREMVSRVIRCMIQRGAVRRYRRTLVVTNRSALTCPAPRDV